MSTHSNPYIQGGWYGQSPFTIGPDGSSTPASVYGALPLGDAPEPQQGGNVVFQLTNLNTNVLNSIVVGPRNAPVFRITTDQSLAGYTQIKDVENKGVALIEWISQPKVEIRGSLPKVVASEWLKVSNDPAFGRSVRHMDFRGAKFVWCPNGETLSLFTVQPGSSPCVMVKKTRNLVELTMTPQALSWGLLEPCVVAVTLLLSGKRLE